MSGENRMKILVNMPIGSIRDSFMDEKTIERLKRIGDVSFNETIENKIPNLAGIDVLITGWGHPKIMTKDLTPELKLIAHTGGTVAPIAELDVWDTGITVLSGNRYYAESVAEGTLAYMLFALRNMGFYSSELKHGIWHPDAETEGLLDQTVGIVSVGAISKNIMRMGKVFRLKFKVFSTHPDTALATELGFEYASLEEIFSECKIVSIHTAANSATENMINKDLLKLLKHGSVLINTARGMVLDEEALVEELKTGRFRAVLDVYKKEPLDKHTPFLKLDNVTLFPHQAGPTFDRRILITNYLIDDIERYIKGVPVCNEITKEMAKGMTQNG